MSEVPADLFAHPFNSLCYLGYRYYTMPQPFCQNAFVLVFMNWLGFGKLITYILAAVVGIPVTFAMLKLFAFRKRKKERETPSV